MNGFQRLLLSGGRLAREYSASSISPTFKANGSVMPSDDDYQAALAERHRD